MQKEVNMAPNQRTGENLYRGRSRGPELWVDAVFGGFAMGGLIGSQWDQMCFYYPTIVLFRVVQIQGQMLVQSRETRE